MLGSLAFKAKQGSGRPSSKRCARSASADEYRDALLPTLVSGRIRVPLSNDPAEGLGAIMNALHTAEC
jgi:hypothetical protein